MKHNVLGGTGIVVSAMGLGTLQFPQMDQGTVTSLVDAALSLGVTTFDTATAYGPAQGMLGQALSRLGARAAEAVICSKSRPRGATAMRADMERSLRDTGRERLDVYMLHDVRWGTDYDRVTSPEGALEAMLRARREGLIRAVGLSTHSVTVAQRAVSHPDLEAILVPGNLVDGPAFEPALRAASERGLGLLGMKALAGGALEPAGAALQEALKLPLDCLFVGVRSQAELEADVSAVNQALAVGARPADSTPAPGLRLQAVAKALGGTFCRGCGYCLPCPAGIPLPDVFRLWRYVTVYHSGDLGAFGYRRLSARADACTDCGDCESRCSYGLPVRQLLRAAHEDLTIGVILGKGQ